MMRIARAAPLAGTAALLLAMATACGDSKSAGSADRSGGTGTGGAVVSGKGCPAEATQALASGEPIKIGLSMPLSGPLASAGVTRTGMRAYFERVNAAGGVAGHRIEIVARDDAYDAARAVGNAQAFVGQEKVFANAAQVSTPAIKATQPIYERACVPQLWVITTGGQFADPANHPWTTLGIPPAAVEAKAAADYIASVKKGASVVELTGSESLGQDFHAVFPSIAAKAGLKVLPNQTVAQGSTGIDQQIAAIVAAKPDAVFGEVLPNYAPMLLSGLAKSGYKGTVVLNSSANGAAQWITPVDPAGDGAVAPMFRKDPADPRFKDDPAMKQYFADMAKIGATASASLGNALDGYNFGTLIAQNLRDAAALPGGLTRVNLMNAAWKTTVERPLSLSPKQVTNGAADPYLVEAGEMDIYRASTKGWEKSKVVFNLEGQTGGLHKQGG